MSKEELEIVKNMIEYFQGKIDTGYHKIFYNDLDSDFKTVDGINVLNKVLEQQKEIEEYKETINVLKPNLEELIEMSNFAMQKDYISKDKIREKIKELEKHLITRSDEFTINVLKGLIGE